ncbi:MAG TPA: hypothetical protein VMB27_23980 [Solirubrobacteraceae bacterium]|nr:hypothetical protein [Solirubrobacteraceae bacterium]
MLFGRSAPALLLGTVVMAFLSGAAAARASSTQVSVIEDDAHLQADPSGTLARMRALGADVVRVSVPWQAIAPDPGSAHPPKTFDATDPASYPSANWTLWDEIVVDARRDGLTVDLDPMGGAPRWALGPARPKGNSNPNWEPSPAAYGAFVQAVATRYSGAYDPVLGAAAPGARDDLPRVGFWSIWNEPNYGPSLAPQGVPGDLSVENSPRMYRRMVDAAWAGLAAAGHGPATDTILIGEFAPRGENRWGVFSGMTPLTFVRALYCVDSSYRQLRGAAARVRGCPTTPAGSRRFAAQHPALFAASGIADHPYSRWYPPNVEVDPDPTNGVSTAGYASLAVIANLGRALDRVQRAYGSTMRFPIWDTEFGYITSPPKRSPDPRSRRRVLYVSPSVAAGYDNWAEYISWRNPRLRSFAQYPVFDPLRPARSNDWGGFASGLETWGGIPKATYVAWRLPLFLPVTSARRGRAIEVWGCVRPASHAASGAPQAAQIQFAPAASGAFRTIQTVTLGDPGNCYFDVRVKFPGSGTVRLSYDDPPLDPTPTPTADPGQIESRPVQISLH